MAKGRKTGGKNFQPGVVTNPNGRPKTPEDLKQARKLTSLELERALNEFLSKSKDELKEIKENPKSTMLQLMIHSIVVNAVNKGDQQRMDFLLNRTIGKIEEKLKINSQSIVQVAQVSKKDLDAAYKRAQEKV